LSQPPGASVKVVTTGSSAGDVWVGSSEGVSVAMGRGVAVGSEMLVAAGDGTGEGVALGAGDVGETRTAVDVGLNVGEGMAEGTGAIHIKVKARTSRIIATIDLKRSYFEARQDASIGSP